MRVIIQRIFIFIKNVVKKRYSLGIHTNFNYAACSSVDIVDNKSYDVSFIHEDYNENNDKQE